MSGGTASYERTDDGCFTAPLTLSYPYARTVGTTLARFFTSLREGRVEGTRGADGRVFVPPVEFDPVTGAPCTEWVEVGTTGTVTSWAWQGAPEPDQPLAHPFAWALVRLDGADVEMFHESIQFKALFGLRAGCISGRCALRPRQTRFACTAEHPLERRAVLLCNHRLQTADHGFIRCQFPQQGIPIR